MSADKYPSIFSRQMEVIVYVYSLLEYAKYNLAFSTVYLVPSTMGLYMYTTG